MTSIEGSTGTVMFVEAVRAALRQAMVENDRVVLLGEDVGNLGGVFRASDGLKQEFGAQYQYQPYNCLMAPWPWHSSPGIPC